MPSMRDIRMRIKSVKETMQITKAMNLISSSKLRKARKQLNDTLPYFEKIQSTIKEIMAHGLEVEHRYLGNTDKTERKRCGYIVITADKGLCGSYNHNVIRLAEDLMKKNHDAGSENYLFVVGHMGRDYFKRKRYNIDIEFLYTAQNPTLYRAREISEMLVSMYDKDMLDEIYVVYTKMYSAVKQQPEVIKLLPLEKSEFEQSETDHKYKEVVTYDPSPARVMDILVPNYVKGLIFGTLVEAFCSEQSARMTAMDAATNSASDMIKELSLLYNRARQAAITQEISEIVGGANAL